ncbi:MAG: hypothetical protein ACREP7_19805 [Lysobacter sp.]
MTAQAPQVLLNECEALDFDGLHLRAVLLSDFDASGGWGDFHAPRARATPDPRFVCTALWSGYRSVYRIDSAAHISLVGFDYPFHKGRPADIVNEALSGDLWLYFSERFGGPAVYVPVKSGCVQAREQWCFEMERGQRYVRGRDLRDGEWPPPPPLSHYEANERARRCSLVVRAEGGLVLAEYKLYVDRNIARTPAFFADRAPGNGVYVRLSEGSHSATLREWDPAGLDRMVSNTLQFDLDPGEAVEIVASRVDRRLRLEFSAQG